MALKSTVYKVQLQIADLDRNLYEDHALTLACHPSENSLRLMMRVLAFALNARERLEFADGISNPDQPDLWAKSLTGDIDQWIQVGNPDEKTLLKACGRAREVVVYSYNQAPKLWWSKAGPKLDRARNLKVFLVEPEDAETLGALAEGKLDLQVMVQDGEVTVRTDAAEVPVRISRAE